MKTMNNLTDQQLIHLFIQGNTDALSNLIERYKDKIYTSIYLLVKDRYLAEDLFQDTFIKVIDTVNAGRYTEEGKFLPWVMRIARNLCVDHFRKVKRSPSIKTCDNHDIFETISFYGPGADEKIMQRESYAQIHKMLDVLPNDQKEVIVMRHFADLSFKEIAQITDCSVNTALGRMRYGLINLRKIKIEKHIAL